MMTSALSPIDCVICTEPLISSGGYFGHCMYSVQDGKEWRIDHFFHTHCVKDLSKPTCPLCRRRFLTGEEGLPLISSIEKNDIDRFTDLTMHFIFPRSTLKNAILAAIRSPTKDYLEILVKSGWYTQKAISKLLKSV